MIERYKITVGGIAIFLLLGICFGAWPDEGKITALQKQISTLEKQKAKLEAEGEELIAKGDKLSFKIDALKIQAKGGLGIIGKYKLSRSLRKAQTLSEETQNLKRQIREVENELKVNKKELEEEYDGQIALLLDKLNGDSQAAERGEILEKLKEYQTAREQLKELEHLERLEHLDITKIEIQKYDGPQEIREKADLINDFAIKLQNRIDMLNTRAKKLVVELKTRERLGEFAEEISFFGERISRDEVVSDSGKEAVNTDGVDEPKILSGTDAREPRMEGITVAKPLEIETPMPEAPGKIVVERNGVSASFAVTSLARIEKQIELLGKQEQDLEKELAVLMEKATSFYKKADEVEKSETKEGGKKDTQK